MIGSGLARRARAAALPLALALFSTQIVHADASERVAPPSTPAQPQAAVNEEAATHFKRGLQLFDEGDYTLALVEFERAYQLAPNYRALYNIALVDVQLGRYADAARTLEQYLHDGQSAIAPARLAEVKKTLDELQYRTATVEIATNATGGEVTLDGKPLDPSSLRAPMVIDAGEHTLRATAPGYQAANKTVTLAGGDRAAVRLMLVSLAQPHVASEPVEHHKIFWPGFIATGAFAAGAIVTGALMLDANSHLTSLQNTVDSPESERETWASRVRSEGLVADIFTGAAILGGAASIYLSLRPDHSQKSPSLGLSPERITLSGSF